MSKLLPLPRDEKSLLQWAKDLVSALNINLNKPQTLIGNVDGEVTGPAYNTRLVNAAVTSQLLTGVSAGSGTISALDTILTAFGKLIGNFVITKTVEIDFSYPARWEKTFTITDADVKTTSKIIATQSGAAATDKTSDEAEEETIMLAALPATGQFTLYAKACRTPVGGAFKINYSIA